MGRNQYCAGRVYDLCVHYMMGTLEGSTKSGFMEKPGIEPAIAMGWSAVYDCGISLPYPLRFLKAIIVNKMRCIICSVLPVFFFNESYI